MSSVDFNDACKFDGQLWTSDVMEEALILICTLHMSLVSYDEYPP